MILMKIIILVILIIFLIFLIWQAFFKKDKASEYRAKSEEKRDLKQNFLSILIDIAESGNLSKEERNRIYKELLDLVQLLKSIDSMQISNITRHEIEKIVNDYLIRLVKGFKSSREKDVDKLLEGIRIVKKELEKIEQTYRDNSSDLDKEIEFLKRKFSS
jgi:polyhydroxyalkanoate synthesis regulator phasin